MIEMLLVHPRKIISTEHFMEKIWGYDSNTEINVVWAYISYLRKKIKQLDSNIEIIAHRNCGYT